MATKHIRRAAFLAFVSLVFICTVIQAQVARVFVSVNGNDGNTCSNIATPCRTFAGGITQVDADGEVIVLDSGSYGGTTINKAVRINVPPGVTAFAAQPFTINVPGGKVSFRGLTLKALTPGTGTGITVTSASLFTVEGSTIDGWSLGIDFAGPGTLVVKDSTIRNQTFVGIQAQSSSTSNKAYATFERCRFENNGNNGSMLILDNSTCLVRDSVMSGNSIGAGALGSSASLAADTNVENCAIIGSSTDGAIVTNSFSTVRLSNTQIVGSGVFGVANFGGTIESYGNNEVRGNATNTTGTITTVPRI
jgi:hypothetical protein